MTLSKVLQCLDVTRWIVNGRFRTFGYMKPIRLDIRACLRSQAGNTNACVAIHAVPSADERVREKFICQSRSEAYKGNKAPARCPIDYGATNGPILEKNKLVFLRICMVMKPSGCTARLSLQSSLSR